MPFLSKLLQAPQVPSNLRHAQLIHSFDVWHLRIPCL